nr:ribonuclease D [Desulfobacterales bacterium]
MNYKLIVNPSDLADILSKFNNEKTIAVDLEADSMYHFREKVCLIQLSTKDFNFIIDTLKLKDISPIKSIFYNE